ncbi:ABC-type antimicrobial peptide transport system permease subunit [Nonlabens dokdonensis]|uniref:ABC-type antimicrobial peptide transport system permease subunit n=2 Tax=Nonlabens dokdonensis TaxID=328515 RepID=A0ABX5PVR4_9FLAO|nr:ABC transporter permease [Nonlabens dokdonensis]AGC75277.1 putative FtsX family ABC transporter permease [Nonlabens dokdonensis DSW-6]PZX38986.1 ABC-type antimicrobial peptide transport system permease subunit [Nonlabens dokdonensis]
MLKSYFKTAFRNLLKNGLSSFINIFGLAIGMAATILIGLWVYDELSYNSYFENKDKIAQVFQHQLNNGEIGTSPAIPRPLEFALRENYADNFKHIVMASWEYPRYLKVGDKNIFITGNAMQEGAPDMLDLEITQGIKNGLKEKNSIMLSQSAATTLFGNTNAIGKTVRIDDADNLIVTGVYKDIPESNFFSDMEYLIPWKYIITQNWIKNAKDQWDNNSFQLLVQINENTTMESVTYKIKDVKKNAAPDLAQFNPQMFLFPMKDWHLRGDFENGKQVGGRIENVWLFGIIGVFILLLACINFINLSTARSEKRATEVGIRKCLGSQRRQLIFQFLSESFLIVLLAFVFAIGIVLLSLNGFNTLASKTIEFPWTDLGFWLIALLFIYLTSLFSGSYPALYLSSFNPVSVLKRTFKTGRNSSLLRKILVVTQFTISIALIIGTLVVMNQIQYSKDRPTGYNKEGLIQIPVMSEQFLGKAPVMRTQFIASGGVVEMATSSSPTTEVWSNNGGYTWDGKPQGLQEDFAYMAVSYDFVEALGAKIIEGRGFSREFSTDSLGVILNKTAVEYMNIKNPVGKFIRDVREDNPAPPLKIIGVIEDIIMQSPYEPVKQSIYVFDRFGHASFYNLRLNPRKNVSENLALVEGVFKENFPNAPFDYQFVDEEYGKKFRAEERIANLARVFTILAIFISCLGLFGLAMFVAEQRTKEIGIRKVLGASTGRLWLLLSKDFLILVTIALVVASPFAYYIMNQWLQKFSYRTSIGWDVFIITCLGAILITLITTSFQAIKAAKADPIKSLRTE